MSTSDRPHRIYASARAGALVCLVALASRPALAGELDPPAGGVAPTMKDLDDVEPRTAIRNDFDTLTPIVISEAGSYYLAENIDALHSQHGIQITADDVTLDLNGFRVRGNTEVGSLDGIHLTAATENVTIRNGTIEFFFGDGINAISSVNLTLESVRLVSNGDDGVIAGERTIVRGCAASNNFNYGFRLGAFSVITDSTASDNTTWSGFSATTGSTIHGCTSHANGSDGFSVGSYATIEGCTSDSNDGDGFDTQNGSVIRGCTARSNATAGFRSNGPGVISQCMARLNSGNGFHVTFATEVTGCTSSENTGHGIQAGSSSRIVGNTCNSNDGAGVFVSNGSSRSRIEHNNLTSNTISIDVEGTSNIIMHNTSAGTGLHYLIVPGNAAGAVVDVGGNGSILADQPYLNLVFD